MANGDKKKPGVNFDLEEDAEEIFRQFVEENSPDIPKPDSDMTPLASKKTPSKGGDLKVDLHGMTVDEAKRELVRKVDWALSTRKGTWRVKIITGKGKHSGPGGGVLVREMYTFFKKTYGSQVVQIDSDPSESILNGVPIRGHFDAVIKS